MLLSLRRVGTSKVMIESLKRLPDQIKSVMNEINPIDFSSFPNKIEKVVINGMGGSNLGGYIIQSLFKHRLKIPLLIEPGYSVPAYVDKTTLYIISSYSGTTEEPLTAYKTAKRQGAMVAIITSDQNSPLKKLANKEGIPTWFFSIAANPSHQPRLGLGYSVGGFLAIFKSLNLLKIDSKEINNSITQLKKKNNFYSKSRNEIERLAKKLYGREVILISGPLFEGNLRTIRNQWCETGKNFASYLVLSDMNHYSLEGLQRPNNNRKRLAALFLESNLESEEIKKRLELTKEVIKKNGIPVLSYHPTGSSLLIQSFDLIQLGSWLTYYLSLLNHVNPLQVPWVDWFKKQLSTK